jgi:hypothetical protein
LCDDPRAAGFLRSQIAPVPPLDRGRLAKLFADLDSDQFRVCESAAKEIKELGSPAVPALEEALATRPSAEARQRLQTILDTLKAAQPTLAELRPLRAVQALELAGTAESRAVLRAWAGGAPGARLTADAAAALKRLENVR